MLSQLFQSFTQAPQGQQAMQQLARQGVSQNQAMGYLQSAFPAAAAAFQRATAAGGGPQGITDVGQSHYVTNFLSGAVTGLLRGDGIMGAAVDGLQGVVGGHVAQVIATRFGLPQRVAGTIGAIVTPLIIDFLWDRVRGGLDLGSLLGAGGLAAGGAALGAAAMSGGGSTLGQLANSAASAVGLGPSAPAAQPAPQPAVGGGGFGPAPTQPAVGGGGFGPAPTQPAATRSLNDPFGVMGNALPGGVPALGAIASAVAGGMGGAGAGGVLGGLGSLLGGGAMAPGAFTPPSTTNAQPSTSAATTSMSELGSIFQMFGGKS